MSGHRWVYARTIGDVREKSQERQVELERELEGQRLTKAEAKAVIRREFEKLSSEEKAELRRLLRKSREPREIGRELGGGVLATTVERADGSTGRLSADEPLLAPMVEKRRKPSFRDVLDGPTSYPDGSRRRR